MPQIPKKEMNKERVQKLISLNQDARAYFFTKATIDDFDWLSQNGFLDTLKQKSEDPTRYGYRTPEINYVVRVAPQDFAKIVDFMLTVPISMENFNPEVVDRFVWIAQGLPADQLARIVPKILKDGWVPLMGGFNRWGFEYKKMFETLGAAKDYDNMILLAEAVLAIRTREDVIKNGRGVWPDSPFYFGNNDLGQTNAFMALVSVDTTYIEPALAVIMKIMTKVVGLGEKDDESSFGWKDPYYLLDANIFEMKVGVGKHLSYRDDVEDLVATVVALLRSSIGSKCDDASEAKRIYETYVAILPQSRLTWRINLFALTLCPLVFKAELRDAFFRIFDAKNLWDLIGGAEYEEALKRGFSVLSDADQRLYISKVLILFGGDEKEPYEMGSGRDILSSIFASLTEKEKDDARKILKQDLESNYIPRPSIDHESGYAGSIIAQAPIDQEALSRKSVPEIVESLKTEWVPEELIKKDTKQDFLHPLNAEGMGDELRTNIAARLGEYLKDAPLFFDRDRLDPHYTYAFLSGINNILRGKTYTKDADWAGLIKLFDAITDSGTVSAFPSGKRDRRDTGSWLAGWDAVHSSIGDNLQELLRGDGKKPLIDFTANRPALFKVISYLLTRPDPTPESERESTEGLLKYSGSDPFNHAINSTRGRAFQVFTMFVYNDGLGVPQKTTLEADIKKLYEATLAAETTMAITFLFGHYLPTFYYRDRDWARGMFTILFPGDPQKKDLYLASWEGYLSENIYKELFEDLASYYQRAIEFDPAQNTPRKHFKDIDESLGVHMALAFVHFDNFDFESALFKEFWKNKNAKRHESFISSMGRHCISWDNAKDWLTSNKIALEKIKAFWDWALENIPEAEALEGFGFWINTERNVFDPIWLAERVRKTLQKTAGKIDWDYGLVESLPTFAAQNPRETLAILDIYLSSEETLSGRRAWIQIDDKMLKIFKTLYANPETKSGTSNLVKKLLPLGNGRFWTLKDIIESENKIG
jgi:hypothetical protein